MNFDAKLFFTALGLALVLEGCLWTLFPRSMREAMLQLAVSPMRVIRGAGLVALAVGLGITWLAQSAG